MPLRADGAGRVAAARAALVAALRRQREVLEARLFDQMRRSVPAYARLSVEDQQRVRRGVGYTVGLVLRLWEEPRDLTSPERDQLRSLGAERAAMRVLLEEVALGVDEAHEAGWRMAFAAAHQLPLHLRNRMGTDEMIELLGVLSLDFHRAVAAIRAEISSGYVNADRAARLAQARLYSAILCGEVATEEDANRQARRHGVSLETPMGLFLIAGSTASAEAEAAAMVADDVVPGGFAVVNHATVVPHRVIVVPCPDPDAWAELAVSLGEKLATAEVVPLAPVSGALPLRAAYLDGLQTLRLSRARFDQHGGIVRPGAVAFVRLVANAAADYQRDLLRPLTALLELSNGAELIETLSAVLRHREITVVAKELKVHRNTVRTRIVQVEARTGLSLDDADDRLVMAAALYAHRLRDLPSA